MAEGTEVEDRVDLEEGNYMEEMDDDVEDQLDEDGEDDAAEPHEEENGDEDSEDSKVESGQKEQSPEADRSHVNSETAEEEQKPTVSVNEEDKEKHAHLLSLPPHGAEVFIGGLPKDAVQDDLRDLCEPLGDIYEATDYFFKQYLDMVNVDPSSPRHFLYMTSISKGQT